MLSSSLQLQQFLVLFCEFRFFIRLGSNPNARHDPMTTIGTVNGLQNYPLPDKMDSQSTEATPASPAVLSLPLSAPPIPDAATPAITSRLDEPLVAAWNQAAIITHNPFSILSNDDLEGECPPLNSSTSARPPMEQSVLVVFCSGAAATKPTASPRCIQRRSNPESAPWKTVGTLSLADARRPCPRRLQQHRSSVSPPTLSIYGRPNHSASWTRPFLPSPPQLQHR